MLYASISVSKKYSLYPKNIIAYAVKTNLIFAMQPGCEQGSKAFLGGDHISILISWMEYLGYFTIPRDYKREPEWIDKIKLS